MEDAGPRATRFLDADRAATLAALVDRVFPADDDLPAATDLGVVDFIDGQLARRWGQGESMYRGEPFATPTDSGHGWQLALTPAEVYGHGLDALRAAAEGRHGRPFDQLDGALQDDLIAALERDELPELQAAPAPVFFELLLAGVTEGLFSDPIHGGNRGGRVWRWLGYPGDVATRPPAAGA